MLTELTLGADDVGDNPGHHGWGAQTPGTGATWVGEHSGQSETRKQGVLPIGKHKQHYWKCQWGCTSTLAGCTCTPYALPLVPNTHKNAHTSMWAACAHSSVLLPPHLASPWLIPAPGKRSAAQSSPPLASSSSLPTLCLCSSSTCLPAHLVHHADPPPHWTVPYGPDHSSTADFGERYKFIQGSISFKVGSAHSPCNQLLCACPFITSDEESSGSWNLMNLWFSYSTRWISTLSSTSEESS